MRLLQLLPLAYPRSCRFLAWPPARALARAASLRASSCTRRSPPRRRTIRIPISLPASLSPYGRVRNSRSLRRITCVSADRVREFKRDGRCWPYRRPLSVSPRRCRRRRRRRTEPGMCESPPGLLLQVCEFFHSDRSRWQSMRTMRRGKKSRGLIHYGDVRGFSWDWCGSQPASVSQLWCGKSGRTRRCLSHSYLY